MVCPLAFLLQNMTADKFFSFYKRLIVNVFGN